MEYLVGLVLAAAVGASTAILGMDRDRALYPTVLMVVASYYVLFAAMGASGSTLAIEIAVAGAFSVLAAIGFKGSLWLVAAAIAGHGIFDLFHHLLIHNAGVPAWWPGFCSAFDVMFGGWVAVRMRKRDARA